MAEDLSFFAEIGRLADAVPFRAFQIFTTSGRKYDINDRSTVTIFMNFVLIVTPELTAYVPVNQINCVEVVNDFDDEDDLEGAEAT